MGDRGSIGPIAEVMAKDDITSRFAAGFPYRNIAAHGHPMVPRQKFQVKNKLRYTEITVYRMSKKRPPRYSPESLGFPPVLPPKFTPVSNRSLHHLTPTRKSRLWPIAKPALTSVSTRTKKCCLHRFYPDSSKYMHLFGGYTFPDTSNANVPTRDRLFFDVSQS